MEELKIYIPEGMIIDVENSDLLKGIIKFKKNPDSQKKWEDFGEVDGWYIDSNSKIVRYNSNESYEYNRFNYPTKTLAKASLALCQLLQWRNKVWKEDRDWKPDWSQPSIKCIISTNDNKINSIGVSYYTNKILAFRTVSIRDKFLKDHKDLIEQAKELL